MLLIVGILSLMPAPEVGVSDKLSHLVTYFFLGGWFGLLAANRVALGWTIAGLVFYGVLLELLQGLTVYRYAEWGDVIANASGTVIGIMLYFSPLSRAMVYVDSKLALICHRE